MSKHTPGPWSTAEPDRREPYWMVCAARGVGGVIAEICSCPRPEAERNPKEAEANARLIAASPRLLAALKGLVRLKAIKESDPEQHDRLKEQAWADARAAIRAAEGEGEEE